MAGRQPISLKSIPGLKSPKNVIFIDNNSNGTAKFHNSKCCGNNTCCCSDKGGALARGGGGGGLPKLVMEGGAGCTECTYHNSAPPSPSATSAQLACSAMTDP